MRIPEARAQLFDIADEIEEIGYHDFKHEEIAEKIRHIIVNGLVRRSQIRRAAEITQKIPQSVKAQIKWYAEDHPNVTYHEIAIKFGIRSPARISEICAGYRK